MSKGIGAGLKLDNAARVLTDVSMWMRSSSGDKDVDRLDGTVWQPDIPNPIKTEERGFATLNMDLTVKYSPAAFTFYTGIEGMEGLNYAFGPEGFTAGRQKISGLFNCLSVGLPSPSTNNIQEFTVKLSRTSEVVGVW